MKKTLGASIIISFLFIHLMLSEDYFKEEKYIQELEASDKIPELKLGWIISPNIFISEEKRSICYIVASENKVIKAVFNKVCEEETIEIYRKKYRIAAEGRYDPRSYYKYHLTNETRLFGKDEREAFQVLYSTNPIPKVSLGYKEESLNQSKLNNYMKSIDLDINLKIKYKMLKCNHSYYSFLLFALYMTEEPLELQYQGIILLNSSSQIIASEIDEMSWDTVADGMALPTYKDGLEYVWYPLNTINFKSYEWPFITLDTSTIEGRSISLITITPEGVGRKLLYEYVVGLY